MQTQSRFLDDIARLFSNAAGAAQGVREEVETLVRQQVERFLADFDLVQRDEFDAVQAMAAMARAQSEALERRVATLEERLRVLEDQPDTANLAGSGVPGDASSSES